MLSTRRWFVRTLHKRAMVVFEVYHLELKVSEFDRSAGLAPNQITYAGYDPKEAIPGLSSARLYEIPPKIRETVSDKLNEELANQDIGPLSDEEAFEWVYYAALRTTSTITDI